LIVTAKPIRLVEMKLIKNNEISYRNSMELRKDFLQDFLVELSIFVINLLKYNLDLFTYILSRYYNKL
jgi:hypothetical protein